MIIEVKVAANADIRPGEMVTLVMDQAGEMEAQPIRYNGKRWHELSLAERGALNGVTLLTE